MSDYETVITVRVHCDCAVWDAQMKKFDAALDAYPENAGAKMFTYCPWCGNVLCATTTTSKSDRIECEEGKSDMDIIAEQCDAIDKRMGRPTVSEEVQQKHEPAAEAQKTMEECGKTFADVAREVEATPPDELCGMLCESAIPPPQPERETSEISRWISVIGHGPDDVRTVETRGKYGFHTACFERGTEGDQCWWASTIGADFYSRHVLREIPGGVCPLLGGRI